MNFVWRYQHTVLLLCTAAFFATMVARLAISPVVPAIAETFDRSTGLMGLALTGMWGAYALMQFPSGVLADRFGERQVILTAVVLTALSALLLAASPNFATFALFAVVLGAGAGLHFTVATTFISRLFRNTGRAVGIHASSGAFAGLLAPIAAAFVGVRFGWRAAILLGFVAAVPVALAFAARVRPTPPDRPEQPVRTRFRLRPLVALLSRGSIAYTSLLAFLSAFVWQATASFLPTFLIVHHGLSAGMAGLLFSIYFAVQGLSFPTVGWLSDRVGRDRALVGTFVLGIGGYALLVVDGSLAVVVVAVVCCGVSMSYGAPLTDRFLVRLSSRERNAGYGLVRTVYMLLGALGSVVTGVLADVAGWDVAFGLLSLLLAVAVASILANRALKLRL